MALLRHRWLRTRYRFASRQNFCLSRYSPLDSSNDNDRPVMCSDGGQRYKFVLAPQTVNQSAFARAEHLLRQREKIPERPHQIRALRQIWLQVSRPDGRFQFKHAIGQFFNPHKLVTLGKTAHTALVLKRAIIAPGTGHWEAIFLS